MGLPHPCLPRAQPMGRHSIHQEPFSRRKRGCFCQADGGCWRWQERGGSQLGEAGLGQSYRQIGSYHPGEKGQVRVFRENCSHTPSYVHKAYILLWNLRFVVFWEEEAEPKRTWPRCLRMGHNSRSRESRGSTSQTNRSLQLRHPQAFAQAPFAGTFLFLRSSKPTCSSIYSTGPARNLQSFSHVP